MGKKVKPSSLLDSTPTNQENVPQQEEFEDKSLVGNGKMTAEAKEKLEKYDALEKSVASFAKEKEMLEAKLAEYANRLAELQTAADQISELTEANARLQKELDQLKSLSDEVYDLKKEVKSKQNEIDNYLVRISELTFENANLTCQLDELGKKMESSSGTVPNQDKFSLSKSPSMPGRIRPPRTDAYNPYSNNGYGTWN